MDLNCYKSKSCNSVAVEQLEEQLGVSVGRTTVCGA